MKKTAFAEPELYNGWRKLDDRVPEFRALMMAAVGPGVDFEQVGIYSKGGSRVIVSRDDRHGNGKLRWHLSISRPERYPGWNEIKDARYSLLPKELTFAMLLPPPGEYVNVHRNCFHLWEIDDG